MTSPQIFTDHHDLRARNRRAVEQYLETGPEARLRRYTLYTEDGTAALFYTDIGRPIVVTGREKLKRHNELSLEVLPDWRWFDVHVYETQDPGQVMVECDGEGTIRFPGYPEGHYRNHFIHGFTLRDGLIAASREYTNPIEHMKSLGIETPHIRRDWIPTD
ncbi:PhzA/PhzB family protein [Kitasatospora purpeofusca]|uniref:EpaJ n=1 Tax=Kitasatospora sp. HKI 714 TaxID=1485014 RepID=X5FNT8_9ACTN|nr:MULTISPECIES: PhzA/PhzB family protein [Streptomycetaceae]AHW81469.1 EpaJ [Kitasatospora sp. HKI 714]MCX4753775.1 phenazine biosynthesis protein [Kitasatospora purpeofusca]WSR33253.1 phenazine biosynthesis protein [Kitasatospora purpeofusca]WSR41325.1 phenazine biosynthesis protein [Kitasatospora purpeofusca]WTA52666.1 phenazine biosynthesis protein [Kitasatospora purpeofusca]